jgi:isoleucyl-tRNA synthetase
VHLTTFPDVPKSWNDEKLSEKWDVVRDVRRVVLGALEPKRADKTIGSSLEAHPQIFVAGNVANILAELDMAEVTITSQATVVTGDAPAGAFALSDVAGVGVVFEIAKGGKCERCWKVLPDVGSDAEYPTLSKRDADAVRYYAAKQKAA